MKRVLFVCLGNICRSPTADGLLRAEIVRRGLQARVEVDSCGTSGYHVGELADANMRSVARDLGTDLSVLRSRQLTSADYRDFDVIVAMDRSNLAEIRSRQPQGTAPELLLFMDFVEDDDRPDVPDPYYGGRDGFVEVYHLVEDGVGPLLDHVLAAG